MHYSQILEAYRKSNTPENERHYIGVKDGALFEDWDNLIKYPSKNDSGLKKKTY